jgi:long-subunit fatty acid transport protein
MKRILVISLMAALFVGPVIAGGIVTNTNQSAKYTRMQCRDATLGIDAVYYNPAGVTRLGDGFHFSINNQIIGQGRKIGSDYPNLHPTPKDYEASVSAPLFPGVYAAFVAGKFGASVGFNPIGGGGSAEYKDGLPSLEYPVSDLVPLLVAQGQPVTDYRLNMLFEGKSLFYGIQANLSYQITDMLSVAVGGRYVIAREAYTGHMQDIQILLGTTWMPATTYFNGAAYTYDSLSTYYSGLADQFNTASTNIQNAINLGMINGDAPVTDPVTVGTLTAMNLYVAGMTNSQAAAAFAGASTNAANGAALYDAGAQKAAAASTSLADQEVDAKKTATGITPIVSVNFSPIDMLNIAVKYEFKTKLEFTNETAADNSKAGLVGIDPDTGLPIYLFPNGEKTRLDIPAMISAGVTLTPIDPLLISAGAHYYFDTKADWGGRQDQLDRGLIEVALGAEYTIKDALALSAGWLMTSTGATEAYQTDQSYSLNTNTFGGGVGYKITDFLELNLAGSYTMYQEGTNTFRRELGGEGQSNLFSTLTETYNKNTWIVAVGLDISLAK